MVRHGVSAMLLAVALAASGAFDPKEHAVLKTDRSDGRYLATRGVVQDMMRREKAELSFDGGFSHDEFLSWRSRVRAKLRELLGYPDDDGPARPPKLLSRQKRDGYTLERWEHYPLPNAVIPFLMLVPDAVSSNHPGPAVLCLPGTWHSKESLAGEPELEDVFKAPSPFKVRPENRMALHYCKGGITAIAVDNPGFCEVSDLIREANNWRLGFSGAADIGQYLMNLGMSYMGYAAYTNDRLLDALRADLRIDPRRMAVSGHSLGAWTAGHLMALNEDLAAAVINQGIYRWREAAAARTRPDEKGVRPPVWGQFYCIPGLYRYFDMPDIQAAIAPRPALYCEGVPERDRLEVYLPAYRIAGKPENLTIVPFAKYADPKSRYVGKLPEGLREDDEVWAYYSNDAPNHYFKVDIAVPWLRSRLGLK